MLDLDNFVAKCAKFGSLAIFIFIFTTPSKCVLTSKEVIEHIYNFLVEKNWKVCSGFWLLAFPYKPPWISVLLYWSNVQFGGMIDLEVNKIWPIFLLEFDVCFGFYHEFNFWLCRSNTFVSIMILKWHLSMFLSFLLSFWNVSKLPIQNLHLKYAVSSQPLIRLTPFKSHFSSNYGLFQMM